MQRSTHSTQPTWQLEPEASTAPGVRNEASHLRAKALCGAGRLAFYTGDLEGAAAHLEASLSLARTLGEGDLVARALNSLGLVCVVRGQFERGSALFDEALGLARRSGDEALFLDTLFNLGYIIADLQARPETCALFEQGIELARSRGDQRTLGMLLTNLGMLLCFDGQSEPSLPLLLEGLAVTREVGETWNEARTRWALGHHTLWPLPGLPEGPRREGAARAREHLCETLRIIRAVNGRWETPYILEAFSLIAVGEGDFARGAWLSGASEALRERLGSVVAPAVQPHYERFADIARAHIGAAYDAQHAAGRARGQIMALEDVLSLLPAEGDSEA